jgi:hypothetical protein
VEITAIEAILEDLKGMAASLLKNDVEELKNMKAELDEYVKAITGQIKGPSKKIADEQFEKCRVCAREWICVYCDPTYHDGVKADILREEAVEFFFTMDEKIVAVQKKFFLLAMIDEILNPSEPFTTRQRETKIANSKIRIMAREQGLTANCKTKPDAVKGVSTKDRFWYFGDERNFLQSSEDGLTDEEAIDYLLS